MTGSALSVAWCSYQDKYAVLQKNSCDGDTNISSGPPTSEKEQGKKRGIMRPSVSSRHVPLAAIQAMSGSPAGYKDGRTSGEANFGSQPSIMCFHEVRDGSYVFA